MYVYPKYILQVFGKDGNYSTSLWTPPSCQKTTPPPTTTTTAPPTTTTMGDAEKAQALEDNITLKEKLKGLKQQYNAIGETMYEKVKDEVYHTLEGYLARKKVKLLCLCVFYLLHYFFRFLHEAISRSILK